MSKTDLANPNQPEQDITPKIVNNEIVPDSSYKLNEFLYEIILDAIISTEKGLYTLTGFVNNVYIIEDYINYVYPVVKVEMVMDEHTLRKIKDDSKNIKFKMTLKKYECVKEKIHVDLINMKETSRIFDSHIFTPINMDKNINNEFLDRDQHTMAPLDRELTLYLISDKLVKINKKLFNTVITNENLLDTLIYLFEQRLSTKLLITEPHNTGIIPQILLPYLNLTNSVDHIQDVFGIYRSGHRLFFNFDIAYLLSNDFIWSDVVKKPGEWEKVFINIYDIHDQSVGLQYYYNDKKNQQYYIKMLLNSKIYNNDYYMKEAYGEDNLFFWNSNEGGGASSGGLTTDYYPYDVENTTGYINNDIPSEKMHYFNNDNNFNIDIFKSKFIRNMCTYVMPINDTDIEFLTPNRKYMLYFTNPKVRNSYNGIYMLTKKVLKIRKGNQIKFYHATQELTLSKLPYNLLSNEIIKPIVTPDFDKKEPVIRHTQDISKRNA